MHIKKLAKEGNMKIVAISKTIDNDVGATESSRFSYCIRCCNASTRQFTIYCMHRRSMILEPMGRDAEHALNAGIAGGADIILVQKLNIQ